MVKKDEATCHDSTEKAIDLSCINIEAKQMEIQQTLKEDNFIVASELMQELLYSVAKVACLNKPVLITGETGVGKEKLARFIHHLSKRTGNFMALNSANGPIDLIESELFGHKKGAFTGAARDKKGLFHTADGGTLLLDEIGEMHLGMQAKLLRAIESKEIFRVGGDSPEPIDIRIIAATNKSVAHMVNSGRLRKDIYYRLSTFAFHLPPLRERPKDIIELALYFAKESCEAKARPLIEFTDDARETLLNYPWPGNIRELDNVIYRVTTFSEKNTVKSADVRSYLEESLENKGGNCPEIDFGDEYLKKMLDKYEKPLIINALEKAEWKKSKAAKMLGISHRTINYKIKRLGIRINKI